MPGNPWTPAEDRLVLSLPPAEAAALTGRTVTAVHLRRHRLGAARRQPRWTEAEERLVRRLPPGEVAKRTGRSEWAVEQRRLKLGIRRRRPAEQLAPA